MDTDPVLPPLPEGYEWDTSDGDYNIINTTTRSKNATGLICYVRPKNHGIGSRNVIRSYLTDHDEEFFDNLQDAIDVMTTKFTLGFYF